MLRYSKFFLLSCTMAIGAAFSATPSSAQSLTIKMAHWLPPVHHFTNTAGNWIKSVEAASGGKLKIILDKSALAKPPGQYDLAKKGVRESNRRSAEKGVR